MPRDHISIQRLKLLLPPTTAALKRDAEWPSLSSSVQLLKLHLYTEVNQDGEAEGRAPARHEGGSVMRRYIPCKEVFKITRLSLRLSVQLITDTRYREEYLFGFR